MHSILRFCEPLNYFFNLHTSRFNLCTVIVSPNVYCNEAVSYCCNIHTFFPSSVTPKTMFNWHRILCISVGVHCGSAVYQDFPWGVSKNPSIYPRHRGYNRKKKHRYHQGLSYRTVGGGATYKQRICLQVTMSWVLFLATHRPDIRVHDCNPSTHSWGGRSIFRNWTSYSAACQIQDQFVIHEKLKIIKNSVRCILIFVVKMEIFRSKLLWMSCCPFFSTGRLVWL